MSEAKWTRTIREAAEYIGKRDMKNGIKLLERALAVAEFMNDGNLRAETLTLLAMAASELQDWGKALEYQKRVVAIASVNHGFGTLAHGHAMHMLAKVYFAMEDYQNAEESAITSDKIMSKLGLNIYDEDDRACLLVNNILLAHICYRRGENKQAADWLKKNVSMLMMGKAAGSFSDKQLKQLFEQEDIPMWKAITERTRQVTHLDLDKGVA